eukprot:976353-Rhodomonas_salina.1
MITLADKIGRAPVDLRHDTANAVPLSLLEAPEPTAVHKTFQKACPLLLTDIVGQCSRRGHGEEDWGFQIRHFNALEPQTRNPSPDHLVVGIERASHHGHGLQFHPFWPLC